MSRRTIISLVAAATVAAIVAATAGVAGASPAATAAAAKVRVVNIVMADPGCHWFSVNGKNKLSLHVKGKTAFRNLDEAALIFKGKHFKRVVKVGKTLTLKKRGVYHITMVKQHADDNHLKLVIS